MDIFKKYLFTYLFILAVLGLSCCTQALSCGTHARSSSLTRGQTRAACIGSTVLPTGPPGKSLKWIFLTNFPKIKFFLFLIYPIFKICIYLFIYFLLCWVFVAACGLPLVAVSGGSSSLWCAGFSLWWLLLLQSTGSRHVGFSSCDTRLSSCGSRALERRLSSCGSRAYLLHGMWDLPGPGFEPVSPSLAGGFLTTAPPGNPPKSNSK